MELEPIGRLVRPPINILAMQAGQLRVTTLGRFGLWIEDQRVRVAVRAGGKPLEVLKALIGLGTTDISLARLEATVWPELDGAAARNACHVAIHRLRRVLGIRSAITIEHGAVTLNLTDAWVDVEVFRSLASRIRTALARGLRSQPEIEALADELLAAYPGHFLPEDERLWVIGVREQLRARFVHLTIELSAALERAGAFDASIALNRHGIELDPVAETFHRGLMRSLIALGRQAEALEAYRHCRATLRAGLRVEPSAETYALQANIRQL
ncbi:MAG TPA: bacterial transcriptional activator domain-containing protein [Steroidobacteraceae bacterium]|jgi:DNA-binding SARP family transcriptional activator